jgi:hypothetical protein
LITRIQNRLSNRRKEERKAAMLENLKCRVTAQDSARTKRLLSRTNLVLTELLQLVVATKDVGKEERGWRCPYCECGLPELQRYHGEMSRRMRLKDKRPTKNMKQAYYDAKKKFREDYRKKYRATAVLKDGRRNVKAKSLEKANDRFGENGRAIDYLPVIFPDRDVGQGCMCRRPKTKMCVRCRHDAKSAA